MNPVDFDIYKQSVCDNRNYIIDLMKLYFSINLSLSDEIDSSFFDICHLHTGKFCVAGVALDNSLIEMRQNAKNGNLRPNDEYVIGKICKEVCEKFSPNFGVMKKTALGYDNSLSVKFDSFLDLIVSLAYLNDAGLMVGVAEMVKSDESDLNIDGGLLAMIVRANELTQQAEASLRVICQADDFHKRTNTHKAKEAAAARYAKDKDAKQKAKAKIREQWIIWQNAENPKAVYPSKARFVSAMLNMTKDSSGNDTLSYKTIYDDWDKEWKNELLKK